MVQISGRIDDSSKAQGKMSTAAASNGVDDGATTNDRRRTLQFLVDDVLGFDPVTTRNSYGQKIRKYSRRRGSAASDNVIDWDNFLDLLERDDRRQELARIRLDPMDVYLLHAACALAAPADVMEAILKVSPPCAFGHACGFGLGATPLHLACHFRCPSSSVILLLAADCQPLHVADACGRLPLHVACLRGKAVDSAEVVRLLIGADPDLATLGARDSHGSTPLQLASQFARSEVVEAILSAYLEADSSGHGVATVAEVRKQLPLHKALQRYPSDMPINAVKTFAAGTLSSSHALLTTKDRRGRLPLHLACQYGAGKAVFDDLINNDSTGGTFVTSDDNEQTPSDLLIALVLNDEPRSLRTLQDIADVDLSRRFFGAVDSNRRTMLDRLLKAISAGDIGIGLTRLQRDALLCVVACTPPGVGRYAVSVQRCRDALDSRTFNRVYRNPHFHRTMNNLMCKRPFTFYFMVDLYVRILLVVFYTLCSNYTVDGAWLSPGYFVALYLCCTYLLLWQLRLAWSHQLYYLCEVWNILDLVTNVLVIVSVGLLQAGVPNEGGFRSLNVLVGGLVWFVIVAAALRSTFKHFSVFLSGLTMASADTLNAPTSHSPRPFVVVVVASHLPAFRSLPT
jgi:Ankyrin repeats (3 copies)